MEKIRIRMLLLGGIGAVILVSALAFWQLLDMVIVALSLAVVVGPLHRHMCSYLRNRRLAALATTFFVLLLFVGTLLFIFTVIIENGVFIVEIITHIVRWVHEIGAGTAITTLPIPPEEISEWIEHQILYLEVYSGHLIRETPFLVIKIFVLFTSLYLFVLRGDLIWREVLDRLPDRIRAVILRMKDPVKNTLYAIYVVHFSTAVLTFFLAIPFFYVLGYGHIIFFALIAGVFQLFPMIGDSALMLFVALYALSLGDLRGTALIILIGYPVVSALPDMYYRPLMMGNRTAIHPTLMWIGFFGGAIAMGTIGIILGPVFIAVIVAGYPILIDELKKMRMQNVIS